MSGHTTFRLVVGGEADVRHVRSDRDDAIAQAHAIADDEQQNVAVYATTTTMVAYVRPSHTYQGPEPLPNEHEPHTVADAIKAAFAEGMRTGLASRDLHSMSVPAAIEFRWRESEAFDFHRALTEVSR